METLQIDTPLAGPRPFYHRGSRADLGVIDQMFHNHDYSLARLRRGVELLRLAETLERPLIIDAGANIGASVCWFAMHLQRCHIVAFEPDRENFELMRRNTEGYNVDLRLAALGAHDGCADLVDPGEGEWGYRTVDREGGALELVSISRIVKEKIAEGYSPYIAKIDIEGGEGALFAPPADWVDQFPLLIVELHDWLLPRQGTARPFLQCIANRDRDFVHIGENIFSIRND